MGQEKGFKIEEKIRGTFDTLRYDVLFLGKQF